MHSRLIGHITSVIGITVVKELKLKFGANCYFILKDEMYSFQSLTGPRNAFAIIHGLMRCDLHIEISCHLKTSQRNIEIGTSLLL